MDGADIQDVKLARPIAVVDLWDIDDRISHLEEITERLEKVVQCLIELYRSERVKGWELLLKGLLEREERKGRMIKPMFRTDFESDEVDSENRDRKEKVIIRPTFKTEDENLEESEV